MVGANANGRLFGFSPSIQTVLLGTFQILLPVSFCYMGYTLELTFRDWLLRVLTLFSLILIVLLLLVDSSLGPSYSRQRIVITPPTKVISSINNNNNHVNFFNGTKFFRLPKPKSKRQLLEQQPKPSLFKKSSSTSLCSSTSTPPPNNRLLTSRLKQQQPQHDGQSNSRTLSPAVDWKRAHRLLQAAVHENSCTPCTPTKQPKEEEEREESTPSLSSSLMKTPEKRHDIEELEEGMTIFGPSLSNDYDGDDDESILLLEDGNSDEQQKEEDEDYESHLYCTPPIKATPIKSSRLEAAWIDTNNKSINSTL
jgi:hypothetical protein